MEFAVQTAAKKGAVLAKSAEEIALQPTDYGLEQNYPNPFNPETTIRYNLPENSHVMLKVFDMTGREVATLVDSEQGVGSHSVQWNAYNIPSGVYFYQLTAGSFKQIKRMLLLK